MRRAAAPAHRSDQPGRYGLADPDLAQGTYRVTARSGAIAPATIRVGPAGRGAQDQLLQP